jgi:hypothetical protein
MLDAFLKKNVRRFLATREHSNDRDEDAITSMVFTPLRFMTPQAALGCFSAFMALELEPFIKRRLPVRAEILLWPSGMTAPQLLTGQETRCEPDILAKFSFGTGEDLILLGEMKWAMVAEQSLRLQIERERIAVEDKYPKPAHNIFKFAIVKYRGLNKKDVGCDALLTWSHVHSRLRTIGPSTESAIQQWISLVADFLSAAEQLVFEGFDFDCDGLPIDSRALFFNSNTFESFVMADLRFPPRKSAKLFYGSN